MSPAKAALVVVALFLLAAMPLAASAHDEAAPGLDVAVDAQAEGHEDGEGAGATTDRSASLDGVAIWTMAALGIFAVVLAVFYFFKRQVGGFPENPAWVAPITIMASKDFADEGDYGEAAPAAHGQAGH